jgi:hypothetical protein
MKQVPAPCSSCIRETTHNILHEDAVQDEEYLKRYAMIQCGGCQTISLVCQRVYLSEGTIDNTYYPSPVSRRKPKWLFRYRTENIGELIDEIYKAVDGGQHRLAAMGIRALLEQVMTEKVGDLKTFDEKLDAFQAGGFISLLQRDAMSNTLEIGHAAMHRAFKPSEQELNIALDIVESIFGAIYEHSVAAATLTERVPPRASKPGKTE